MYPSALAEALRAEGIDASTAAEHGLGGQSDADVLTAATAKGCVLLTENVADFTRLAGERLVAGGHHPGLLIALSSRFSRRRGGIVALVAAVRAVTDERLEDRVVYLKQPPR